MVTIRASRGRCDRVLTYLTSRLSAKLAKRSSIRGTSPAAPQARRVRSYRVFCNRTGHCKGQPQPFLPMLPELPRVCELYRSSRMSQYRLDIRKFFAEKDLQQ